MELPEEAGWLQLTPISSQPFSLPPHQRAWSPLHQHRSVLMLSPSSNIRSTSRSWHCWLRFWSTYPLGKASLYPSDASPANNGIYWPFCYIVQKPERKLFEKAGPPKPGSTYYKVGRSTFYTHAALWI